MPEKNGEEASEDALNGHLVNTSKDYIDNRVNEDLHPGLSDSGIAFSPNEGCFAARRDYAHDDQALSSCQQAFAEALRKYEESADPKYKTGIDLKIIHSWDDVLEQVEFARHRHVGVNEKGILRSVRNGLRSFSTAAPAIQAWLGLLPSDTTYTSVLCGGIELILSAAVRLGKLREDTFDAIDQIPLRIERARNYVRTYHRNMRDQAANLYRAILEALQHIVSWYQRKASLKFIEAFSKSSTYANDLRVKMRMVESASQAMGEEAGMEMHYRLNEMHTVARQTKRQLNDVEKRTDELRYYALEARNHLYNLFRDTDLWRDFVQTIVASGEVENKRGTRSGPWARRERETLLGELGHDRDVLTRDIEEALNGLNAFRLVDQDRAAATIEHDAVQRWIVDLQDQALLIHGNCRRDERMSPTSAATAMLIRVLSNTMPIVTLYWFCGSHVQGLHGNVLGMIRSLICQLLSLSFAFDTERPEGFDSQNICDLLDMFLEMLRRLPKRTAVVCIIDGISFYEGAQQRDDTCKAIRKIAKMVKSERIVFKLMVTSPRRTSYLLRDPKIAKRVKVVEIPQHVDGPRQGFAGLSVGSSTDRSVRRLSASLEPGERPTD